MSTKADVIFTWFASSPALTAAVAKFQRPTQLIEMPAGFVLGPDLDANGKPKQHARDYNADIKSYGASPLRAIAQAHGIDPLRVCLIGFSQGCQGVRAALTYAEGGKVDSVIACDGIHTQFDPKISPAKSGLVTSPLVPYAIFARKAMNEGRLFVISTSSIVPGDFVSTTVTSDWIWRQATGDDADRADRPAPEPVWAALETPPVTIKFQCVKPITYTFGQTYRYRNFGGFVILNYANLDGTGCADHIYQAQHVLPLLVSTFLKARWDAQPPTEGICLIGSAPTYGLATAMWSDPLPSIAPRADGTCDAGYALAADGTCAPASPCPDGTVLFADATLYPSRPGGVCAVKRDSVTGQPICTHPHVLGDTPTADDDLDIPDDLEGLSPYVPGAPGDTGSPATLTRKADAPVTSSRAPLVLLGLAAGVVLAVVRHRMRG